MTDLELFTRIDFVISLTAGILGLILVAAIGILLGLGRLVRGLTRRRSND